jgi:hypothetical protein
VSFPHSDKFSVLLLDRYNIPCPSRLLFCLG